MSLIEIKNLRKAYPNAVPLENVSVNIDAGEVISIIGPSGTGKSTFLRCINGLEKPTSGEIWVDGVNVCDPNTDLPEIRKKMGMVFQSFNLFPHKMAAENIMMPQQQLLGVSAADAYPKSYWRPRLGLTSTSSPAVRSSAWRLPAHWRCIQRSCSLTNPPARSIPTWYRRCCRSSPIWQRPA